MSLLAKQVSAYLTADSVTDLDLRRINASLQISRNYAQNRIAAKSEAQRETEAQKAGAAWLKSLSEEEHSVYRAMGVKLT